MYQLSPAEYVVLHYVARGLTNAQVGQVLAVTESTVKNHMRNIMRDLAVQSRTQAAILYWQVYPLRLECDRAARERERRDVKAGVK